MEINYRRCISCRATAPKPYFLRVVRVHPTGEVRLHEGMGRSAYLCPQKSCVAIAPKKKRLERALKAVVPPEVYEQLEQLIQEG
ncbi:MAG: YlxR family protein [Thermosynechococcaceae cyanobacterium MS004]|nr:YlxR family protein [Thermosynechococcaceae cyanobacterium MS004]